MKPDEETTPVFELPDFDFNSHVWIQEGYRLIDHCGGGNCLNQAIAIPVGKMLVKTPKGYDLIDESA